MEKFFYNSVAVVTGGSSGIGKEIVRQLADAGATVIIIGRNREAGDAFVAELTGAGKIAAFEQVDMAIAPAVKLVIKRILKQYGRIDYMFNNAGIFLGGEVRDTPIEDWQNVINNNIFAVTNGAHYAYQAMIEQGFGHIVNTASAAGLFPVPAMGVYGSTKFAIVGLSQTMRIEAKKFGVKVSVVCPTVVNTPLYDTATYNDVDVKKALKNRDKLQTPETAARRIIRGVMRNQSFIHTSFVTHFGWLSYRVSPWLYGIFAGRAIEAYRRTLRKE